eukprot:jgi/Mesvir1/28871/Mv17967-RA.1
MADFETPTRHSKEHVIANFNHANHSDEAKLIVDEAYEKYEREQRSALVIQRYWRGYLARRRVKALKVLGIKEIDVELLEKARSIKDRTRLRDWRAAPVDKSKLLGLLESRHETRTGYSHVRVYTLYLALVSTLVVFVQEPSTQYRIERPLITNIVEGGDLGDRAGAMNLYDVTTWGGYLDWVENNLVNALFKDDTKLQLNDLSEVPFSLVFALEPVDSPVLNPFLLVSGLPYDGLLAAQAFVREHYGFSQEDIDAYQASVPPRTNGTADVEVRVLDIINPPFIAVTNKVIPGIFIDLYPAKEAPCSEIIGATYGIPCFKDEVDESDYWTIFLWSHYDLIMAQAVLAQLRAMLPAFLGKVNVVVRVYNGNEQRFAFITTETWFFASGHVSTRIDNLGSVSTEPFTAKHRQHTIITLTMLTLFCLSIAVFMFRELSRARIVIGHNGRGLVRYLTSFFCWLEWTTIVFSIVFVGLLISFYRRVDQFYFMDDEEIFESIANQDLTRLLELGENITAITKLSRTMLVFASWVVVLSFFKVIKFFRFEGKVAHLSRTLLSAAGDIGHFLIITLFLLFGLVIMGNVLFGHGAGGWSTIPGALMRVFEMIVAVYNYEAMYRIEPQWTGIYIVVVSLVGAFILLNVFIAIILEGFAGVIKDDSMSVTLGEEMTEGVQRRSELFHTLFQRMRGKGNPPKLKFMASFRHSFKSGRIADPTKGVSASSSSEGQGGRIQKGAGDPATRSIRSPAMKKAAAIALATAPKGMRCGWSLQTDLRHAIGWLHVWPGDTITMRAMVRELSPMEADLARLLEKYVTHLVAEDERQRREQEERMYGPGGASGGGWGGGGSGGREASYISVTGSSHGPAISRPVTHALGASGNGVWDKGDKGGGGDAGGSVGKEGSKKLKKTTSVTIKMHTSDDVV